MKKGAIVEVALITSAWYFTSFVTDNLNKRVQSQAPLPVTLTLFQFLVGAVVNFVAICVFRLVPFQRAAREHARMLIGISMCWTIGFLLTNYSFGRVAVSFAHSVKATEPLTTVALCFLIDGTVFQSAVYISLLPIVGGIVLVCANEVSFQVVGLVFAALANIAFGTRSVLSKTLFKKGAFKQPLDNFNLFMYISAASFVFTTPLWIATEAPLLLERGYKTEDHELYWMALANGVTHCMYNQFSFMILARISTMAHSIMNASRRFFVIFLTVIAFGHPFNSYNFLGTILLLIGVVMYARTKGLAPAKSGKAA